MNTLAPNKSIVPIVKVSVDDPIQEILGTGSFIGVGKKVFILTAKHIFEGVERQENDKFAFVLNDGKGIGVWAIRKITACLGYDIAICEIEYVDGIVPLQFSKQQASLNADVFCYEYSSTRIEAKKTGGKHVSFEPLAHKGNIMRYFDSEFPEKIKTPSFNTSFPALQGASGAPVISATNNKNFFIAGILVANQETHLLPAQVVEIVDGPEYLEQTSYFLPMGKAINASLISQVVEQYNVEFEYVE
jgi:hypothetical protein